MKLGALAVTLTIHLSDEGAAALQQEATLRGLTLDAWIEELARERSSREAENQPANTGPVSARIRALWADMPDAAKAQYPEGGAMEIDRHVYGAPKR
jgi:hypothetical protein